MTGFGNLSGEYKDYVGLKIIYFLLFFFRLKNNMELKQEC